MSTAELATDQLAILRLIDAFHGRLSPAELVHYAQAVAGIDGKRLAAIGRHLDELRRLGLIELVKSEGEPECRLTEGGMKLVED